VRTLRHAAALLGAAHSIDTLLPIAAELSFDPVPLPLDAATRDALGIPDEAGETRLVRGRGALPFIINGRPGVPQLVIAGRPGWAYGDTLQRIGGEPGAVGPDRRDGRW